MSKRIFPKFAKHLPADPAITDLRLFFRWSGNERSDEKNHLRNEQINKRSDCLCKMEHGLIRQILHLTNLEKQLKLLQPSDWPPNSPDLNLVDFGTWGILEMYRRIPFSSWTCRCGRRETHWKIFLNCFVKYKVSRVYLTIFVKIYQFLAK